MVLCYCEHQEVVARVMVKFVKTKKKTFLQSMGVQRPIGKVINYKFDGTPIGTSSSKSDCPLMDKSMCTPIGTSNSKSDGTPVCTPIGTPNSKSDATSLSTPSSKSDGIPMTSTSSKSKGTPLGTLLDTPMGTQVGTPNIKSRGTPSSTHKKQDWLCNGDPRKVKLQLSTILLYKWHTKTELKMIEIEDVHPNNIGSLENVQVQVKPNEEVSSKSKFPMSLTFHERDEEDDTEDVMNDEEENDAIYDDNDDVCDSMTKDVGSSYNSPDVNKHDRVKTSDEGEVDKEPGGNVSARSRSLRFRQSKA